MTAPLDTNRDPVTDDQAAALAKLTDAAAAVRERFDPGPVEVIHDPIDPYYDPALTDLDLDDDREPFDLDPFDYVEPDPAPPAGIPRPAPPGSDWSPCAMCGGRGAMVVRDLTGQLRQHHPGALVTIACAACKGTGDRQ